MRIRSHFNHHSFTFLKCASEIQFFPCFKIGPAIFHGTYADCLGTDLLFEKSSKDDQTAIPSTSSEANSFTSGSTKHSSLKPGIDIFNSRVKRSGKHEFAYFGKTTKSLILQRVFLKPKWINRISLLSVQHLHWIMFTIICTSFACLVCFQQHRFVSLICMIRVRTVWFGLFGDYSSVCEGQTMLTINGVSRNLPRSRG